MTTSAALNEYSEAEESARVLLERLGWSYVPREALAAERSGEREVLLKGRLRAALLRLNEWLTQAQAERVIFDLEHVNEVGIVRNQKIHEYLTFGLPLTVNTAHGQDSRNVRFFDFDNPGDGLNEFVVTTQFRVRRGNEKSVSEDDTRVIKPDLVLFVNGIPLVVMEAKSPSLMDVWKSQAVRQLRRYQEAGPEWHGTGAPELFHYNLLCVAHCGASAAYAATGAPENAYFEWKSVAPYSEDEVRQLFGEEPQGQAQLIVGMLDPATLLDILRDYVVYEPEHGRLVKKLPRYQQYRAATTAMRRILSEDKAEERGGVVWHTQGSGKSLTMLWLATKIRREPRLANADIVVVTDRTQLDKQISDTFRRCGFPAPERMDRSRPEPEERRARRRRERPDRAAPLDLQTVLKQGGGRTVMTTIQKFEEALITPAGKLDVLNNSDNVFIMVDEAHRTQYGVLGSLMSQALPNAVMIGFTGTPIDKGFGRSTMKRFGPLIDSYTIPQSVADGATVPIWYEARMPDLHIEGPDTLDKLFDAMFGEQPDSVREEIRRRYANRETVAEAEQRIQMIALDIAQHFKDKVRPNGFKAQVVTPSRAAALRYTEQLRSFGLSAYPIITTGHNDGPEFQLAKELDHDQITNAFVDPDGEPEVLVVVDMLLTGFDAPPEQVLYLDKPLREHGLLQAIARVNRRFSHEKEGAHTEKDYGLVVDYCGISHDLQLALSSFDWSDVQDTMQVLEDDPATVIEAAAVRAESHFKGQDLEDTWACVLMFAPDANTEGNYKADLFERFNADYRQFARLMDRLTPDPRGVPYADRLARLTKIRSYTRAHFLRENADVNWTDIGAKVKQLIDQRISAEVRQMMEPVSILDRNFDEKIAQLPHAEARASVMEHAIRAQIHQRLEQNPVFYERLSQRLARIIEQMRSQLIDAAEAYFQMAELRKEIQGESTTAVRHGLSPVSLAIYEILQEPPDVGDRERRARQDAGSYVVEVDAGIRDVALEVEEVIARHTVIDWQNNYDAQREMRQELKGALRTTGIYTESRMDELANLIVQVAKSRV